MNRFKFRIAFVAMAFPLALLLGIAAAILSQVFNPPQGPHYGDMGSVILGAIVALIGSAVLPFKTYRVGARWDAAASQNPNEKLDFRLIPLGSGTILIFGLVIGITCFVLIVVRVLDMTLF